jgi:hypothetical protein
MEVVDIQNLSPFPFSFVFGFSSEERSSWQVPNGKSSNAAPQGNGI